MKRKITSILAALALILSLSCTAFAESGGFILDEADKLRDSTELRLMTQEAFDTTNAAVCYASCESIGGVNAGEYIQQLYDEKIGSTYGLILLDCDALDSYCVYASRALRPYLSDDDLSAILRAYSVPESYDKSVAAYITAAADILAPLNLPADSQSETVAAHTARVTDSTGAVDAGSLAALNASADELSEKYACDVALVFVSLAESENVQDYSDSFYYNNNCGYGENYSGVLLALDVANKRFAVTTGGRGVKVFTDYGIEHMEKTFAAAVKRADWADAAERYISSAGELLSFAETEGRAYSAESAQKSFPTLALVLVLAVLLALAYVFRARIKTLLKTMPRHQKAETAVTDKADSAAPAQAGKKP